MHICCSPLPVSEEISVKKFENALEHIWQVCNGEDFIQETQRMRELLTGKPLVLYGAGTIGDSAARLLTHYHIVVDCFCDKNKSGVRPGSGLPILSPSQMIAQYPEANIIICSVNYREEIIRELARCGIPAKRIFCRDRLHLHEMVYKDFLPHVEGYRRTYGLLQDNQSKQVLLERIGRYLTSSPITASECRKQYFDPEIVTLDPGEVFVDGGMYTGDTAQLFVRLCNGRYRHYYGFEPDEQNFLTAEKDLMGNERFTLVKKGLWSQEGRLSFSGNLSSGSRLDEGGSGEYAEVTALDMFFQEREAPTFIKMDIEGAEKEALIGAEQIIRCHKPKLAICVYHKPEDIYVLPELINSFREDYRFYLRHYSNTIYETELYAV